MLGEEVPEALCPVRWDQLLFDCESAGFKVKLERKVGNGVLTSGYLMGFGLDDFPEALVLDGLIIDPASVGGTDGINTNADHWLYMSSALILEAPPE